jgi:deoxyhypusine synthase
MRKNQILSRLTHPLAVDGRKTVAALLEKMQGISFQGRALATVYQIWKKTLGDRVMIMTGMSGAMVPAGI